MIGGEFVKMLSVGQFCYLFFHWVLVTKMSRVSDLSITGRPIRNETGRCATDSGNGDATENLMHSVCERGW